MRYFLIIILCIFYLLPAKAASCSQNSEEKPKDSTNLSSSIDIKKYLDMVAPKISQGKMSLKIEIKKQELLCNEDPLAVLDEHGGNEQERNNLVAESLLEANGYDKNAFSELLVELTVNYDKTKVISEVLNKGNEVLIPLDDLQQFYVKEEYLKSAVVTRDDKQYIDLGKLSGTKYEVNSIDLALNIIFPPVQMQDQNIVIEKKVDMSGVYTKSSSGAFLNYDLLLNNQKEGQNLSGVQDFTYFNEKGSLNCGVFTRYDLKKNIIVTN